MSRTVELSARRVFLLLFGAPGTGKGTFGRRLASDCDLFHLETGDLLRREIGRQSALGRRVSGAVANGLHVGDDVICDLVRSELKTCSTGVILDGFPRTVTQAILVKSLASTLRSHLLGVDLTLPRNILVQRLTGRRHCSLCNRNYNLCTINSGEYVMDALLPSQSDLLRCPGCSNLKQRVDDTEEIITRRLETYETNRLAIFAALEGVPIMNFAIKHGFKDYESFKTQLGDFIKQHIE